MTRGTRLLSVLPTFVVPDVEAAQAWYAEKLGFRKCGTFGEKPEQFGIVDRAEGQGIHFKSTESCGSGAAGARRNNGSKPSGAGVGSDTLAIDAYIRIPDADRLHEELQRRGANIVQPPTDRPWKQRVFLVQDLDGFVLCFGADTTGTFPPNGFSTAPELVVKDIRRSTAFYKDGLGFPHVAQFFDPPRYAIARREGAIVHFTLAEGTPIPPSNRTAGEIWDAYVEVVGVDVLAQELRSRGVKLQRGPEDTFYGAREIEVVDPDGYHIAFGELGE